MIDSDSGQSVLVTGGTGFVGVHCILQLLQQGYRVKTTLRLLKRKDEVIEMLRNGGLTSFDSLSFIEADLTTESNWDEAVKDCAYVLHVASPIFLGLPKHEDDMILPAVNGTLRVLKASRDAGVKRVVLTSSFAAVGYSHTDASKVITEESWTNPDDKTLGAYVKSKVLAEKAAWNFMTKQAGALELAVVNPVGIFGPSLGPVLSSGFEVLNRMLNGSMKALPKIKFGIVDVRDVADLHLRAMKNPKAKGQRFLAISGNPLSLKEIAVLLKKHLGANADKVSTRTLPDWVVRSGALFSPTLKLVSSQLGKIKTASSEKSRTMLGWAPRTNEDAIIASAESMVRFGVIK